MGDGRGVDGRELPGAIHGQISRERILLVGVAKNAHEKLIDAYPRALRKSAHLYTGSRRLSTTSKVDIVTIVMPVRMANERGV